MSALAVVQVQGGVGSAVEPFRAPHFKYVCPRCGYAEITEQLIV